MIDYNIALILVIITYIVALINLKYPIFGLLVIFIDCVVFIPEPIETGKVVMAYVVSGITLTPIYQTFSWLSYIIIVGIALSSMTALLRIIGEV